MLSVFPRPTSFLTTDLLLDGPFGQKKPIEKRERVFPLTLLRSLLSRKLSFFFLLVFPPSSSLSTSPLSPFPLRRSGHLLIFFFRSSSKSSPSPGSDVAASFGPLLPPVFTRLTPFSFFFPFPPSASHCSSGCGGGGLLLQPGSCAYSLLFSPLLLLGGANRAADTNTSVRPPLLTGRRKLSEGNRAPPPPTESVKPGEGERERERD